jgi:guanylate kinase
MKNLILVVGRSGSGKDTLLRNAQKYFKAASIPSYTDRPMRPTETQGVEHTFVSKDEFDELMKRDDIFAYTQIGETGYRYCTTVEMLKKIKSKTLFYIIDPKGYWYCKSKFCDDFIMKVIYVSAREDFRRARANIRNGDEDAWKKRNEDENSQFEDFERRRAWDHLVYNNSDIEHAKGKFLRAAKLAIYGTDKICCNEVEETDWLLENGGDEKTVMFRDPSFPRSLVGVSTDGRAIYSLDKMIQEYADDNDCSEEDAADFISYNTLGALQPSKDFEKMPIVMAARVCCELLSDF